MGVNFFGFDSIPIFMGGSEPSGGGPCASQIKLFDVYYIHEPIVGVHVMGATGVCDVAGFYAMHTFGVSNGCGIVGFYASQDIEDEC